MASKLLIAGVDQTVNLAGDPFQPAQLQLQLNERSLAIFNFQPGFLPNRFDEVLFYERDGVTEAYGGVVLARSYKDMGGVAAASVQCADWWAYLDWAPPTSRAYSSAVSLKTVLTDLIADCNLASYGISLDPAQVTGPTLQPFAWSTTKASDAIRSLTTTTGGLYVAAITPGKVLSMFALGTRSAPFSITESDPHCSDFDWQDPTTEPATRVTLLCGPSGSLAYNQSWVQAGGATSWQADIPEAAGSSGPAFGLVQVGAGVLRTVTVYPDTSGDFYWDRTTSPPTLRLGTDPVPTNGTVLSLTYTAASPFVVVADSGLTPAINETDQDATITTLAAGNAEAAGRLAQVNQSPRTATIVSDEDGWLPGQKVSVTLPTLRAFTGNCSLTSVQVDVLTLDVLWNYTMQATETVTAYQGSFQDQWRSLVSGGGGATAISGGAGGTVVTTLSAPVYLGGSRKFAEAPNPAAWTPVIDYVPFTAPSSFSARVRVQLFARLGGVGVSARLYDVTAAAPLSPATSVVTSTTPTEASVVVAITAGHVYRLELLPSVNGGEVYGVGTLEAA